MSTANQLDQLKQFTTVVADTGDFASMKEYAPRDATTNPSLILKAATAPTSAHLLDKAVKDAGAKAGTEQVIDQLLVLFGVEILKIVPGRVSTEVDARLSFDRDGSIAKAREIIGLYEKAGISRERVLIKLASTWEGIKAAEQLQKEKINCNMTLLFSFCQAVACAEAKVQLISPFVGRIYDWFKKTAGKSWDEAAMAGPNDPGVRSVEEIYRHYKAHGIRTEVMAASFRNTGQILALAGCDLMTISPALLAELAGSTTPVERRLALHEGRIDALPPALTEAEFHAALAADAMARDKLAEGITQFIADTESLEQLIRAHQA